MPPGAGHAELQRPHRLSFGRRETDGLTRSGSGRRPGSPIQGQPAVAHTAPSIVLARFTGARRHLARAIRIFDELNHHLSAAAASSPAGGTR